MNYHTLFNARHYFTVVVLAFLASFVLLPSSKAVNNFFYILLLLPASVLLVTGRVPRPKLTPMNVLWLAFFLWLALIGLGNADSQFIKYLFFTTMFCLILWLWVDWQAFECVSLYRIFFWVLILYVAGSVAFYWLTNQVAFGERVLSLPRRLDVPILTSILIVSCFALLLPGLVRERRWMMIFAATAAILFCVGFVLQSRSGLVGLAALLIVVCAHIVWCGGWYSRIGALLIVLLVALLVTWLVHDNELAASLITRADSGRFELWQQYFQEWRGCGLWLGCGPRFNPEVVIEGGLSIQHPHNIFLAMGFRYGVAGLCLFVLAILATLQQAWQQQNVWGGYLLVALLMLNFDGRELVDSPHESWLLLLLPAMLIAAREQRHGCAAVLGARV